MSAEEVRVERDGAVTTVILDRPRRRNAVDGPTAAALADAFRDFEADPSASVAILWGAGGTFCAGADLHAMGGPDGNRVEADGDGPMGPTRMRLSKPVIGRGRALDLILTGRPVAAEEAERIGLVERVVPAGQALAAARALAQELADLPQACLREDRLSALEQEGLPEREALAIELAHGMRSLAQPTAGVERFRAGAGRHGSSV